MPLEVHYVNDKSWDAEAKKFSDPKIRQEADDIGHLLMTIGVSEISEKTINEIVIRKIILDRLYGDKKTSAETYKAPLERHMGLKIEGRWASNETRWKFTSRHAKGMMRDVSNSVLDQFVKEMGHAVFAWPILHYPMQELHTSSGCIEKSMWAGPTRRYKKGLST